MVVSLYDYTISDTKGFMFSSQSITVTPYPKANTMKQMEFYLYLDVFLNDTNIIIAIILLKRLYTILLPLQLQTLVPPPHKRIILTQLNQISI